MAINASGYRMQDAEIIVIASDAITPTQEFISLTSQTGTADNLATINLTSYSDLVDSGDTYRPIIVIKATATHTITVKDGTGNIHLSNGDVSLTGDQLLALMWNGSKWSDLNIISGGGGGGMTSFNASADSGTPQTIGDGNTLNIEGGTGIDTVAGATDKVTVSIDGTVVTLTGTQTLSGKTFAAPVIADFTGAGHNHTNAAGGGQLTDSALASAVGIAKGGTGQTTASAARAALGLAIGTDVQAYDAQLADIAGIGGLTAGDLLVYDGANIVRLPVGSNMQVLTVDTTLSAKLKYATPSGSSVNLNRVMDGRLTATSGTPVTTADVTAVTSVYYTPYLGNQISLYVSSVWTLYTFTERTLSLSGLTANTNYNIYIYDNTGTITLEASATGTVLQDGVLVKSGATERRFVGVVRITNTTGQTEDSLAKRFINNHYNQVIRKLLRRDTTNNWSYAVVAFRAWNNDSTNNRLEFVLSNNYQPVRLSAYGLHDNNGNVGSGGVVGIGIDSTTVNSADANFGYIGQTATLIIPVQAFYLGYPSVSDHVVYPLESVTGAIGMRFYGDNNSTLYQTGFMGEVYG